MWSVVHNAWFLYVCNHCYNSSRELWTRYTTATLLYVVVTFCYKMNISTVKTARNAHQIYYKHALIDKLVGKFLEELNSLVIILLIFQKLRVIIFNSTNPARDPFSGTTWARLIFWCAGYFHFTLLIKYETIRAITKVCAI